MNWQRLMMVLAPVRGRWDLAVLANLEERETRPGDLIQAINAQAEQADGRQISWKVLIDTLRRLEEEGHVAHREISRLPRETRYWLLPSGRRLIAALNRLDAWYEASERASGTDIEVCEPHESPYAPPAPVPLHDGSVVDSDGCSDS